MYPNTAWERVHATVHRNERHRAIEWLRARFAAKGYDQFRVDVDDLHVVYAPSYSGANTGLSVQRVYLPFYVLQYRYNWWQHTALVNAMDGGVGAQRLYSLPVHIPHSTALLLLVCFCMQQAVW
jgi:hypothetical protein